MKNKAPSTVLPNLKIATNFAFVAAFVSGTNPLSGFNILMKQVSFNIATPLNLFKITWAI